MDSKTPGSFSYSSPGLFSIRTKMEWVLIPYELYFIPTRIFHLKERFKKQTAFNCKKNIVIKNSVEMKEDVYTQFNTLQTRHSSYLFEEIIKQNNVKTKNLLENNLPVVNVAFINRVKENYLHVVLHMPLHVKNGFTSVVLIIVKKLLDKSYTVSSRRLLFMSQIA